MMRGRTLPVIAVACSGALACRDALGRDGSNRWLRVVHDSGYDIALDTTRITPRYGQEYVVWYRTDHAVTHAYEGKPFNREVVQAILHCRDLSYRIARVDMSLRGGRFVARQRADDGELGRQPWRHVDPGTIEAAAARATCDAARRYAANRR